MKLALVSIKPNFADTLNCNRDFIESILSNVSTRYSRTFLETLQDPRGLNYSIPLVTYILFRMDDIIATSNREHGNTAINYDSLMRFVNMFVTHKTETLPPAIYYIPKFNLHHHGNICHLNTCLLMISSLYDLLVTLNGIANDQLTHGVDVLRSIMLASYSPIDMQPCNLLELIRILRIDISQIIPAEETMVQLINLIEPVVSKNLILNWDFAHNCLPDKADTDLTMNQIIDKYVPLYLLVNGQDFNVATEVSMNNQFIPTYSTGNHLYKLSSVIVHMGAHFFNIFMKNDECIVKDDLVHRFKSSNTDITKIGRSVQITQVCYVRVK